MQRTIHLNYLRSGKHTLVWNTTKPSAYYLENTRASVFADYRYFWWSWTAGKHKDAAATHRQLRAKSQPGGMSRNYLHSPQFCLWLMMASSRQRQSGAVLRFILHYITEEVTLVTHNQSLSRKAALTTASFFPGTKLSQALALPPSLARHACRIWLAKAREREV